MTQVASETRTLSYVAAINEAMRQSMEADPNVFLAGEDVAAVAQRHARLVRHVQIAEFELAPLDASNPVHAVAGPAVRAALAGRVASVEALAPPAKPPSERGKNSYQAPTPARSRSTRIENGRLSVWSVGSTSGSTIAATASSNAAFRRTRRLQVVERIVAAASATR